ncbi:MAG: GNAT family N-acetyltransferase [Tissierellia bacterium]|nr:GNAT family N-acetyltransferase [Tissierellia bacterium]
MEINWTNDLNNPVYKDALKLRLSVFVDELKGSLDVEISDEDGCIYSVVYEDDIPIAAGRIYSVSKQLARLQRIAVKKEYRNRGYGKILIDSLEKNVKPMA